jgi:hypothetical protein
MPQNNSPRILYKLHLVYGKMLRNKSFAVWECVAYLDTIITVSPFRWIIVGSALTVPKFFFLICIVGGWIKVHSTLRPLNGLLCQPQVIMIMEKSVEWLAGETEILGENLPQSTTNPTCCPYANARRRGGEPVTNRCATVRANSSYIYHWRTHFAFSQFICPC